MNGVVGQVWDTYRSIPSIGLSQLLVEYTYSTIQPYNAQQFNATITLCNHMVLTLGITYANEEAIPLLYTPCSPMERRVPPFY
jgi:hypothetical protein